eukprot:14378_1
MGAVFACSADPHEAIFEKDRFDHTIGILKSYGTNPAVSGQYIGSVERCYNEENHTNHSESDYLVMCQINSDIDIVMNALRYFLIHYQTATNIPNYKFTDTCTCPDHTWENALHSREQIHFILHHTSALQVSRRLQRRCSRFIHLWTFNRTVTPHNTTDISESTIDEKEEDTHTAIPIIQRKLPQTPIKSIFKSHHDTNHRSMSLGSLPALKHIFSNHTKTKPDIPLPILISYTSSQSMEHFDDIHSPIHSPKSKVMYKKPLPPTPTKIASIGGPGTIQRERSKSLANNTCTPTFRPLSTPVLRPCKHSSETCPFLKAFLNDHQGNTLLAMEKNRQMSDTAPGTLQRLCGTNHPQYTHCITFHSEHHSICDAGNKCKWNKQIQTETYMIHRHFFHDIPMHLELHTIRGTLQRERRQRFSTNSKVKYKKTLRSLVKNESKQLEFGHKYEITDQSEAKYRHPKEEMLKNEFHALQVREWNDLLKKSVYYMSRKEAKRMRLGMKDIVSLKLYTDFDALQRHFRKCFRDKKRDERLKRQKSFYYWYKQLGIASNKSDNIISHKLYHGVDVELPPSTFCGMYHGPVSTTLAWDIAVAFAGSKGQVIELYPSFGKKGLMVNFLSNFPDEQEVLYLDCSFQISNIFKADETGVIRNQLVEVKTGFAYVEHCMLKALQMMSVDSQVISLNAPHNNRMKNTGFSALQSAEKISILYVLYLQYRTDEWQTFVSPEFSNSTEEYMKVAMAKYRDMFVSLASNVKAVRMERLSTLLQIFFCTPQKEYSFPFKHESVHSGFTVTCDEIKKAEHGFKPHQSLCFETICLLFPNAEQISINAHNWDFSLNAFIGFLEIFDLDDASVALQDIYIRFVDEKTGKIMKNDQKARRLRPNQHNKNNFKRNLRELRRLGWMFVTASHLHRVGFEPLPELPFLRLFVAPQKDLLPNPVVFQSYSSRFSIASYLSSIAMDFNQDGGEGEEIGEQQDNARHHGLIVVDHNPQNCILSNYIFDALEYKDKLVALLKWRLIDPYCVSATKQHQNVFKNACLKVKVLVLDPMSKELQTIFYTQPGSMHYRRNMISFFKIRNIFPNVEDLFLCDTTFSLNLCLELIRCINKMGNELKLQRIFFCKHKPIKYTNDHFIKQQLNDIHWDFAPTQQTVFNRFMNN